MPLNRLQATRKRVKVNMKKTSDVIRERRKNIGVTQDVLAEKLGITTSYLSLIENNRREPSLKLRKRISKQLDIPLSLLVLGDIHSLVSNKHEKELSKMLSELYDKIQKGAQNSYIN